jgi:hypothetical protein
MAATTWNFLRQWNTLEKLANLGAGKIEIQLLEGFHLKILESWDLEKSLGFC